MRKLTGQGPMVDAHRGGRGDVPIIPKSPGARGIDHRHLLFSLRDPMLEGTRPTSSFSGIRTCDRRLLTGLSIGTRSGPSKTAFGHFPAITPPAPRPIHT